MSRPTEGEVELALAFAAEALVHPVDATMVRVLATELEALRNQLEYERQLRLGLERMLHDLGTQLTAADEVCP